PHDRAVAAGAVRAIARGMGVVAGDEIRQRTSRGNADVEAATIDGILAGLPPLHVPFGLVVQVPSHGTHAVGQSDGHARIIRPFSSFQAVWTTGTIAGHRRKAARTSEFDGGP